MHQIFDSARILIAEHDDLSKKCSSVEAEILNFYHILELEKVDAISITKVVKKLRVALRERRAIKERIAMTTSLMECCKIIVDKEKSIKERSEKRMKEYDELSIAGLERIKKEM